MKIIHSQLPTIGADYLAHRLSDELKRGKRVLWMLSGGSNIPIEADILRGIRTDVSAGQMADLTVTMVDERYGPIGHNDSNWQQLIQGGFDFKGISMIPVLRGLTLNETALAFSRDIEKAFKDAGFIVAQLGIGSDGHIAGILPGSPAESSQDLVCAYESDVFDRITLTYPALEKINEIYAFAFGEGKKKAAESLLQRGEASMPCSRLICRNNVYLYTDQVDEARPRGLAS